MKKNLYAHKKKEGGLHKWTFLISSKMVREKFGKSPYIIAMPMRRSLDSWFKNKFLCVDNSVLTPIMRRKYYIHVTECDMFWWVFVRYLGQLTWHGSSVSSREIQTNCAIAGQYVSFIGSLLNIIVFICLSENKSISQGCWREIDQGNYGEIARIKTVLNRASIWLLLMSFATSV